jgi:hypothetical protein
MENWEQILIERGYKNLDEEDKKAMKALLAQAWKEERLKRSQDAPPWDIEQQAPQGKGLAPEANQEKRYYRVPGSGNVYKPVDRDGLPVIETKKEADPDEVEAYHNMLDRRVKAILQHGKVSAVTLSEKKSPMVFKGGG